MAFDWIKIIDKNLLELEERPQFGLPAPFPLEELQNHLRSTLEQPSLTIKYYEKGWVDSNFFEGIGMPQKELTILWPPIQNPIYWVMSEQDLSALMVSLLGGQERNAFFVDAESLNGFYNYLGIEVANALSSFGFAGLQLERKQGTQAGHTDVTEPCYVVDVDITINQRKFTGRLCIPKTFRTEWKRQQLAYPQTLSDEWKEKITVDVSVEIGDVGLNLSDWKKAKKGDFIILDRCTYDPVEKKGSVLLTMEGRPIFRARVRDEGIKLSEYPTYEEVDKSMNNQQSDFDSEEDKDLYGDLEEEEDLFDEMPETPAQQTPPAQPPPNPQAANPAADQKANEQKPEDMIQQPQQPAQPPQPQQPQQQQEQQPAETKVEGKKSWEQDLTVRLSVEVTRIRMPAKELMNLTPGNLIDLQISPEQGVDLVLNGKKIGKGELVRMGDTLGVRILSL